MFDAPFYYMPMPVNKDGNGPSEPHETVRTLHEVWDAHCSTFCECGSEVVARWTATMLTAATQVAEAA
jgi:hypothetical protein